MCGGACVKIIGWMGLDEWLGGWGYQVVLSFHCDIREHSTYVHMYIQG